MEVGAVKQAYNNEVIQLKKNLNQAKIHTIHKLTRKAKTFATKKAPEKLKEKLKRKAESAVNEVLILKKIKPRDIARFTVTHTGELMEYLNKPTVDHDKACARLLLHKSLQEKYKNIRTTFSGIPIKDLLMSRQERLKLKKEALLEKKLKKDKKRKVVKAEGEWNVEDVSTNANTLKNVTKSSSTKIKDHKLSEDDEEMDLAETGNSDNEEANPDDGESATDSDSLGEQEDENIENHSDESESEHETEMENDQESNNNASEGSDQEEEPDKLAKPNPAKVDVKEIKRVSSALTFERLGKNRTKPESKNKLKPKDMQKNKNLNKKLQTRKFKKDLSESHVKEAKVVDPFFITSTGENYMSVVEPRQPDEIKEIHKQGNRKERRAAMFGHIPKVKPKKDFAQNNSGRQNDSSRGFRNKYNKTEERSYNNRGDNGFRNRNDNKDKNNQFKNHNDKPFEGRNNQYRGRFDKPGEVRNDKLKGKNDSKFKAKNNDNSETKPEKLHPSWEAKKKQSGILPFEGKKIVFDEG